MEFSRKFGLQVKYEMYIVIQKQRLSSVSQEALIVKEEQIQQKDAEQRLLQRQVQILLQENKTYLQGLEEEKKRSPFEVRRNNTDSE